MMSMAHRWKNGLLLSFVILLQAASINAEPIHLVTGNNYSPFTGETLPGGGTITQVIKRVFKEMGYEVNVSYLPWKEGYEATKQQQFFATFPYNKNRERLEHFHYSEPIITYATLFYVRHDSPITFHHYQDLQGLTFCNPVGYNLGKQKWLINQGIIKLKRPQQLNDCLKMILAGEADFMSMNPYVGWTSIKELYGTIKDFRTIEKPNDETSLYLIISKANEDAIPFLKVFNRTLDQLKKTGTVTKILNDPLDI